MLRACPNGSSKLRDHGTLPPLVKLPYLQNRPNPHRSHIHQNRNSLTTYFPKKAKIIAKSPLQSYTHARYPSMRSVSDWRSLQRTPSRRCRPLRAAVCDALVCFKKDADRIEPTRGYQSHSKPNDTPCEKTKPLVLILATGEAANCNCSGANASPVIHIRSYETRPTRFGRNL